MKPVSLRYFFLILVLVFGVAGKSHKETSIAAGGGVKNATILIVRHAEKPDSGSGLTEAGEKRAQAYVQYFQHYERDGRPLKLTHLYASADTRHSLRPRLTLEPLSKALGLSLNCQYKDQDTSQLARELQIEGQGEVSLIAWHHAEIPNLLRALSADPLKLLPKGRWPGHQYGWVLELHYDGNGNLISSRRVKESLDMK